MGEPPRQRRADVALDQRGSRDSQSDRHTAGRWHAADLQRCEQSVPYHRAYTVDHIHADIDAAVLRGIGARREPECEWHHTGRPPPGTYVLRCIRQRNITAKQRCNRNSTAYNSPCRRHGGSDRQPDVQHTAVCQQRSRQIASMCDELSRGSNGADADRHHRPHGDRQLDTCDQNAEPI